MTQRAVPQLPRAAEGSAVLLPEHASEEEYGAFLDRAGLSSNHRKGLGQRRNRFVARWPDLRDWLQLPLLERVSRPNGTHRRDLRDRVSYNARSYLIYLCLTDRLRLDYDYLLAVGQLHTSYVSCLLCGDFGVKELTEEAGRLGFWRFSANLAMRWTLPRLALHTGIRHPSQLRLEHLVELTQAMHAFNERADLSLFRSNIPGGMRRGRDRERPVVVRPSHDVWFGHVSRLRNVLYHRGQIAGPPRGGRGVQNRPLSAQPEMQAMVDRWLAIYRPVSRPSTIYHKELALRRFLEYLALDAPEVQSFAQVTREHALGFLEAMAREIQPTRGRKLAVQTRRTRTGELDHFFRDLIRLGWDGPGRPVLDRRDRPPQVQRVPRFIPADELGRLMAAVAKLACPFQRCALLVARWSGARRNEVNRLSLDCLDSYPDGTSRLRIPASKTYTERMVPLHEDAAAPLRALIGKRKAEPDRPLADELTGDGVRYVFVSRGVLLSMSYLFDYALQQACTDAGLVHSDGQRTITAHRFRHTIGTVLAERGAKLHTIMSVLGHRSPGMVMVYARISDPEVLRDYKAVLDADATIAGPGAEVIRSGALTQASVDWLTTRVCGRIG